MRKTIVVSLIFIVSLTALFYTAPAATAAQTNNKPAAAARPDQVLNGSFENGAYSPNALPTHWTQASYGDALFTWDNTQAYHGSRSLKITSEEAEDARWQQTVTVKPYTNYLVSGYIKTENVRRTSVDTNFGGNLALRGTYWGAEFHTLPLFDTNGWTYSAFSFNSSEYTEVTLTAGLGFSTGTTNGTVWIDDIRIQPIYADDPRPNWKFLILIYANTDITKTDLQGITHRYTTTMTQEELEQSAAAARLFVEEDVPVLSSGYMHPTVTIRYPDRPISSLTEYGNGGMPSSEDIGPEIDPAFDSIIIIWDPWGLDSITGENKYLAGAGGLSFWRGSGQTVLSIGVESTYIYGHRNFFKHEWGHSLLFFYTMLSTAPLPNVDNHANMYDNHYVHCPTGEDYLFIEETTIDPVPNSIYNNEVGFTHDYYSGTTARVDAPTVCLGINAATWATGGPVSKPLRPTDTVEEPSPTPTKMKKPTRTITPTRTENPPTATQTATRTATSTATLTLPPQQSATVIDTAQPTSLPEIQPMKFYIPIISKGAN